MLNVAFGFDKRSCNISNVGFDFDSDMSQVLVLISVSAQRGPGSICWFRTPTNEFRLSLIHTGEQERPYHPAAATRGNPPHNQGARKVELHH